MSTSIIIPTLNAEKQIPALLGALGNQTVESEVVIVDSSSDDNTLEMARKLGAATISVRREDFDHGGTRTRAAAEVKGEFIVFMTQDSMPANERAVENLISAFDDPSVGAAYGRQLPSPGAGFFSAHGRLFNYPEESCVKRLRDRDLFGIKTPFLSNSFAAYRRSSFEEIGGFREGLICTEDTYAGAKLLLAGYAIAYVSTALVVHSHNYSVLQEFRRYFDIGAFHGRERWIRETFGDTEGEGRRYVMSELRRIAAEGKFLLVPAWAVRNLAKYAGYALGRNSGRLPLALIRLFSMHRDWWRENSNR